LVQLLQEVETQAILSQQKITQTQAELNTKRRDARLNLLTSNELKSLSKDTNVYEGVGKMYARRGLAQPS
jgi:prefoldin subunit 1